METKKVQPRFECKKCNYSTNRKSSYDKHMLSLKHTDIQIEKKINICPTCTKCNKEYKTKSGVWKHEKSCKGPPSDNMKILIESNKELTRIVLQQQQMLGEILKSIT
jgi:ribosomal protein L44E